MSFYIERMNSPIGDENLSSFNVIKILKIERMNSPIGDENYKYATNSEKSTVSLKE